MPSTRWTGWPTALPLSLVASMRSPLSDWPQRDFQVYRPRPPWQREHAKPWGPRWLWGGLKPHYGMTAMAKGIWPVKVIAELGTGVVLRPRWRGLSGTIL